MTIRTCKQLKRKSTVVIVKIVISVNIYNEYYNRTPLKNSNVIYCAMRLVGLASETIQNIHNLQFWLTILFHCIGCNFHMVPFIISFVFVYIAFLANGYPVNVL